MALGKETLPHFKDTADQEKSVRLKMHRPLSTLPQAVLSMLTARETSDFSKKSDVLLESARRPSTDLALFALTKQKVNPKPFEQLSCQKHRKG